MTKVYSYSKADLDKMQKDLLKKIEGKEQKTAPKQQPKLPTNKEIKKGSNQFFFVWLMVFSLAILYILFK
jgi:hypothetical protein